MDNSSRKGNPFVILLLAISTLIAVSLLPLSILTNGWIQDYNLFSEIVENDTLIDVYSTDTMSQPQIQSVETVVPIIEDDSITNEFVSEPINSDSNYIAVDTLINPRQGDKIIIEDYTGNGTALYNLKKALANKESLNRPVRIAMLGDSYIEGDIFSQHIRELLQDEYGGAGVGYVNMHSEFPGFRRSLKQSSNGWNVYDLVKGRVSNKLFTISQQYSVCRGNSQSTYKGTNYARHLDSWQSSKFVFLTSRNANITLTTSNKTQENAVTANSAKLQCLEISDTTDLFKVKINADSLIGIGVWLENKKGITFDCMSTRGNSGTTLSRLNKDLAQQLSQYIAYDLIILEFGMNAMSAGQKDFSGYIHTMENVIAKIRQCYPNTDILIMGIGDRASKRGNEVHTMSNVPIMINAQRHLAQKCRCAFWDTREAMGGEDASVKWAEQKLVNKDYIHLSYTGGRKLAAEFVKSLKHALND